MNIGRFTVVEATRDDMDNLNILGGAVVDLKNPNDYTYTFAYDEHTGGYTINTEITKDLTEYGLEGNAFYMDFDPINGYLKIRGETDSPFESKPSFFIEETEVESPYIDFGDEKYVRINSVIPVVLPPESWLLNYAGIFGLQEAPDPE